MVTPGGRLEDQGVDGHFEQVGRQVDQRWRAAGRDLDALAAIASEVLTETEPPPHLDAVAVLRATLGRDRLPTQGSATFGQPQLTLWRNDELSVSALYWLDGTTAIHQHSFAGAFRVLDGSSLHCTYSFEDGAPATPSGDVCVGALTFERGELLRAGAVRGIAPGASFIHSLFHLDRPTVTMVVRTVGSRGGTQYEYAPPGLAWDPFFDDPEHRRQLAALQTLRQLARDDATRAAREMIERSDAWHAFLVLQHWRTQIGADATLYDLVDEVAHRHDALAGVLRRAFEVLALRDELVIRRRFFHEPEHRLLFALLMNLPDRAAIFDIVAGEHPSAAPEVVLRSWIDSLRSPSLRGASGLAIDDAVLDSLLAGSLGGGIAADVPRLLEPLSR